MSGHKNLAYGAKPQRPDNKYLENLEDLKIDMLFYLVDTIKRQLD